MPRTPVNKIIIELPRGYNKILALCEVYVFGKYLLFINIFDIFVKYLTEMLIDAAVQGYNHYSY